MAGRSVNLVLFLTSITTAAAATTVTNKFYTIASPAKPTLPRTWLVLVMWRVGAGS